MFPVLLQFVVSGFFPFAVWTETELTRIPSPDRRVEAVLTSADGGATTSFKHRIYITVPGGDFRGHEPFFVAYKLRNESNRHLPLIRWDKSHELLISYDSAQVHHFTNVWSSRHVDNWLYVVRVKLMETGGPTDLPGDKD